MLTFSGTTLTRNPRWTAIRADWTNSNRLTNSVDSASEIFTGTLINESPCVIGSVTEYSSI